MPILYSESEFNWESYTGSFLSTLWVFSHQTMVPSTELLIKVCLWQWRYTWVVSWIPYPCHSSIHPSTHLPIHPSIPSVICPINQLSISYGRNVCAPPKFICWNPNSHGDGIRTWDLWEVISSWGRGPHECPYKRDPRKFPCPFLPCEYTTRSLQPGRGSSSDHTGTLILYFQHPEL